MDAILRDPKKAVLLQKMGLDEHAELERQVGFHNLLTSSGKSIGDLGYLPAPSGSCHITRGTQCIWKWDSLGFTVAHSQPLHTQHQCPNQKRLGVYTLFKNVFGNNRQLQKIKRNYAEIIGQKN